MRTCYRKLVGIASAAGIAALTLTGGATASAAPKPEKASRTVTIYPSVLLADVGSEGPTESDYAAVDEATQDIAPIVVKVPAGEAAKQDKIVRDAVNRATPEWERKIKGGDESASGITLLKYNKVVGTCGWSDITLEDAFSTRMVYIKARFHVNWPATAYRTNIHLWDTATWDTSAWNFPETGNLGGGLDWWDDFTFRVDDGGHEYGAQLNRGEASTTKGWCTTGKPRVDNVWVD